MPLRIFLVALLGLLAAGLAQAQQPNIIIVLSDDQSPETVSAYGTNLYTSVAPTPHIDAIAAAGVRFSRSFVQSPICQPSRTTLLTGKSAEIHGVIRNARLWQPQQNITEMLQAAGYHTAAFGKSLHSPQGGVADFENPLVPVGFDYYNVYDGGDYIDPVTNLNGEFGHANPGYATDLWTQQAIDWIAAQQAATPSVPFFVYIGYQAAHYPLVPRADHANLFPGEIAKPPTYDDDRSGRSPLAAAAASVFNFWFPAYGAWTSCDAVSHGVVQPPLAIDPGPCGFDDFTNAEAKTEWFYQQYVHDYLRVVHGVDENVGVLRAYLASSGLAADTIVMFMADNGFQLADHFLSEKWLAYEQSIRVPLLMEGPGIPAGAVASELVSNLDWAPTILDLAGVEIPAAMEGRSLLELLDASPPDDWREAVYLRKQQGSQNLWFGIRTSRYKLIRHESVNEWELIDLQEDPLELTNVHDDVQNADVIEQLLALVAGIGLPDDDSDGLTSPADNCLTVANANQRDTDLDGYGNHCDGDFNDDGTVGAADFSAFKQAYQTMQGGPGYDPDIDLNGDGAIAAADFALFREMYLDAPGPSGFACAGSPPCPGP